MVCSYSNMDPVHIYWCMGAFLVRNWSKLAKDCLYSTANPRITISHIYSLPLKNPYQLPSPEWIEDPVDHTSPELFKCPVYHPFLQWSQTPVYHPSLKLSWALFFPITGIIHPSILCRKKKIHLRANFEKKNNKPRSSSYLLMHGRISYQKLKKISMRLYLSLLLSS